VANYWVGGATGFLGAHVTSCLLADGHRVVPIARGAGEVHGVRVVPVDVLDASEVEASARGTDGAFLLTGKVSRDPADAEELYRANVLGTRSALAGLRAAGVRRVVVASTSGTIALSKEPRTFDENGEPPRELIARFPYYRSKYFAELDALEANQPGFEVVVMNPSLLLGPGDLRDSSTEDVRKFLAGDVLAVPRGGLAFVDVRDAARAFVSAMDRGRPGQRYLVSAANLTVEAFLRRLERLTDVPAPRMPLPRSSGLAVEATRLFTSVVKAICGQAPVDPVSVEMAQYFWYCDSRKAIDELGFSPRDPMETLRDTVDDLVLRGVVLPRGPRWETAGASSDGFSRLGPS
jgi:dihydroflavonol-4-reductase